MSGPSKELADELAFFRSFCPRFVPCHVEFDAGKSKHRKVPALQGWTQIIPKQSQDLLATRKFDGHRFAQAGQTCCVNISFPKLANEPVEFSTRCMYVMMHRHA